MATWTAFPYAGDYAFDAVSLKTNWARLHRGDGEPLPEGAGVLQAWVLFHNGDFELAAVAGLKAWRQAPDRASRDWLLIGFAFNGFLNLLWSLLFFRLHRPDWSLAEVALLWASVALLMRMAWRHSHAAGWLLAPYLVWVSLAATINWGVVRLNGPFGG